MTYDGLGGGGPPLPLALTAATAAPTMMAKITIATASITKTHTGTTPQTFRFATPLHPVSGGFSERPVAIGLN